MWSEFEKGTTIGINGTEGGTIFLDHELDESARITIEKDSDVAPFSIVLGVYGLMFHTIFCSSEEEARNKTKELKILIERLLATEVRSDSEESLIEEIVAY